jgi:hypothetical protein
MTLLVFTQCKKPVAVLRPTVFLDDSRPEDFLKDMKDSSKS